MMGLRELLFPPLPFMTPGLRCAERGGHPFREVAYGSLRQGNLDHLMTGGPRLWKDERCTLCGAERRVRRDWSYGYADESAQGDQ